MTSPVIPVGAFAASGGEVALHRPCARALLLRGPWRGRHCHQLSPIVRDRPPLTLRLVAGSLPVRWMLDVVVVALSTAVGQPSDAGAKGCAAAEPRASVRRSRL